MPVTPTFAPTLSEPDMANDPIRRSRFERSTRIRFSDCDPAGIVFFPQYFVRLNGLVEDWVTDGLGISYSDLIGRRRIGMPTVNLQTDFCAITRMGDIVTFGLQVEKLGSRSLVLLLDCKADGEERLRARQVIVTTSLDTHRATEIPPDLHAAMERFREAC